MNKIERRGIPIVTVIFAGMQQQCKPVVDHDLADGSRSANSSKINKQHVMPESIMMA